MTITWPLADGRITLRPITLADAPAFLEYQRLPESQPYVAQVVDTLELAEGLIGERLADPDALMCAIDLPDGLVGTIGGRRHRPHSLGPDPAAWDFSLGYSVAPRCWGRGIATAAVRLLVPALHDDLGIRRITAKVFTDNVASIRVLQRCGFRLEGTERAAVLGRDGTWLDDSTLAHLA